MTLILSETNDNKSIDLVTSKGRKISNYQVFELSFFERNQFKDFTKEKFPFVKFRSSPSPEYNCHGMSFASKRTNVDRSSDLRLILEDDGYVSIQIKDTLPGDVVLYVSPVDGDIMHSGTLVECKHPPHDLSSILVISKWGKYREAIHYLHDTGYKDYQTEFYRLSHEKYEI